MTKLREYNLCAAGWKLFDAWHEAMRFAHQGRYWLRVQYLEHRRDCAECPRFEHTELLEEAKRDVQPL